jgi:hypothetical protein
MRSSMLVTCVCGIVGASATVIALVAFGQQTPSGETTKPALPAASVFVVPATTSQLSPQPSPQLSPQLPSPVPAMPSSSTPMLRPVPATPSSGWNPYPASSGYVVPQPQYAPPTVAYSVEPPVRRVIALKSVPAVDLAKTVGAAFRTSQQSGMGMPGALPAAGPTIIADAVSNSVVVRASRAEMEEVVRMIEMLDRPASLVHVEVVVARLVNVTPPSAKADAPAPPATPPAIVPRATAPQTPAPPAAAQPAPAGRRAEGPSPQRMSDVIARLNKDPSLAALYHIQLTTLDGQMAHAQYGRREPRVTGAQSTSLGTSRSVSIENVGQLVKLTPRVDPNGAITLQIDVEGSEIGRDAEGVVIAESPRDGQTRVWPIQTSTLQTTVTVRDGEVVTLSGLNSRRGDRTEQIVCYVSARSVRPGENVGLRGVPRRSEMRRQPDANRPAEDTRSPDAPRRSEMRRQPETIRPAEPIRPTR